MLVDAYYISQILLLLVAAIAALVGWRQVRIFGNIELFKILQEERARAARIKVITVLDKKEFSAWDAADYDAAAEVGATYNIVGVLLQKRFAMRSIFLPRYASSVQRCYVITTEYRREIYQRAGHDEGYWAGFDWLYREARKVHDLHLDQT